MSLEDETRQVALDGTDATRAVPVERHLVDRARRTAHLAANAAVEGDLDVDPEPLARLAMELSEALERDDLDTETVAEEWSQ